MPSREAKGFSAPLRAGAPAGKTPRAWSPRLGDAPLLGIHTRNILGETPRTNTGREATQSCSPPLRQGCYAQTDRHRHTSPPSSPPRQGTCSTRSNSTLAPARADADTSCPHSVGQGARDPQKVLGNCFALSFLLPPAQGSSEHLHSLGSSDERLPPVPGFPWIRLSGILLRTQPGGTGVTLPLPWSSGGSTASHTICSLEQAEPLLQHLIPCLKAALLPPQQLLHCPSSLQLLAGLHLPSFLTPPELLSTSGQAQHQHLPPLRGAFGLILLHRGPWSQGHLDVSPAGERNPDVGYRNGMGRVESSLRWRHTHKPEQISLFFEQSRFL